jgi:hypothetical protein
VGAEISRRIVGVVLAGARDGLRTARNENSLAIVDGPKLVNANEVVPMTLVFVTVSLVFVTVSLVFVLVTVTFVRLGVRSSTSGCGFSVVSGRFATGPNPGKLKVWARRARPSSHSTETDASLRVRRAVALRRFCSCCDLIVFLLREISVSNREYPYT